MLVGRTLEGAASWRRLWVDSVRKEASLKGRLWVFKGQARSPKEIGGK